MVGNRTYIDIFSGCGGLSEGLRKAGWNGLFAVEKNPDAFSTLKYNLMEKDKHFDWPEWLPVTSHDINTLMTDYKDELIALQGSIKMVAGGPPCQGFSLAGKRDQKDKRNTLVKSYIKFIDLVDPEIVMFENVFGFTVKFQNKKGTKQFSSYIVAALQRRGFHVFYQMINMSDYCIPQNRRRFILIGMKQGNPKEIFEQLKIEKKTMIEVEELSEKTTVKEALSDLEYRNGHCNSPDTKGFQAGLYGPITSNYQIKMRKNISDERKRNAVDSHRFVNHSTRIIKLHEELLEKGERGKRITPKDQNFPELQRRGVTVLGENMQAPTITSIPDEIVHYCEPRILTVREYARLQSFPDDYYILGKYTSGGRQRKNEVCRYTQIGNAVPPLFAELLGKAILNKCEKLGDKNEK